MGDIADLAAAGVDADAAAERLLNARGALLDDVELGGAAQSTLTAPPRAAVGNRRGARSRRADLFLRPARNGRIGEMGCVELRPGACSK